mmetsp:Transcript_7557/g.13087  ORF Transcript_7557/g.13087 Transcript_7557/m.13087 type:complete len:86 (-) Transcript_7557:464-721(-)
MTLIDELAITDVALQKPTWRCPMPSCKSQIGHNVIVSILFTMSWSLRLFGKFKGFCLCHQFAVCGRKSLFTHPADDDKNLIEFRC